MIPDGFFFLRPQWLWLIIPFFILLAVSLRRSNGGDSGAWRHLVDAHLLKHLAVQQTGTSNSRWPLAALAAGLLAAIIALAGPTWQKIELPSFKTRGPAVILLSLAQSMNTEDVSPNRLVRAGHKVRDILSRSKGGDLGFIVYSDWPFVAAPLTSDIRVIGEMLPELTPDLMPVLGNRLDLALSEAGQLLAQAGAHSGEIILLADDIGDRPEKSLAVARQLASSGYHVNVLGVGTLESAALQTASGQVIRDSNNNPVSTRLMESGLRELAQVGSGHYAPLSPNNADIDLLFPADPGTAVSSVKSATNLHTDSWNDMGYWLLILPVLLAPLAFRRGMLMMMPLAFALISIPQSQNVEAAWVDWWKTPDQQAASDFKQGDFATAAGTFDNPEWKASALYKSGQYDQAANLFSVTDETNRDFNLGNSLAHTGEFEKAIAAYDQALEHNPADADAKFNRDLVAKLLQQQKQEQKNQSNKTNKNEDGQQKSTQDQQQKGDQDKPQDGQSNAGKGQSSEQQGESQGNESDTANGKQEQQSNNQSGQTNQQTNDIEAKSESGQDQPAAQQSEPQQAENNADGKNNPSSQKDSSQPGDTQNSSQVAQSRGNDDQAAGSPGEEAENDTRSALRKAMDAILQGNGEAPTSDEKQKPAQTVAATGGISELDQTREQQLRAVPDDSAGLLKARIRQHYMRLRGAQ